MSASEEANLGAVTLNNITVSVTQEDGTPANGPALIRPALFLRSPGCLSEACTLLYQLWVEATTHPVNLIMDIVSDEGTDLAGIDQRLILESGFRAIAERTDCWFLTSGFDSDPGAHVAGHAARSMLEQRTRDTEECAGGRSMCLPEPADAKTSHLDLKLFGINVSRYAERLNEDLTMFRGDDCRSHDCLNGYHTHFVLLDSLPTDLSLPLFRARLCSELVRQATEQCIVMQSSSSDRYVSYPIKLPPEISAFSSHGSTLSSSERPEPPIEPLVVCLFMGHSLESLDSLLHHLKDDNPILIVRDSSVLTEAVTWGMDLLRSAPYPIDFLACYGQQLLLKIRAAAHAQDLFREHEIIGIRDKVLQILSMLETRNIAAIISTADLGNLSAHFGSLFVQYCTHPSTNVNTDKDKFFRMLVLWNLPECLSRAGFRIVDNAPSIRLFKDSLLVKGREPIIQLLLDRGINLPKFVSAPLLIQLFKDSAQSGSFFQRIILGQMLGYSRFPYDTKRFLRVDINFVLYQLTLLPEVIDIFQLESGLESLAPSVETLDLPSRRAMEVLTFWALLCCRVDLCKLLWCYSFEPLSLALILSQAFKSLAYIAKDWDLDHDRLTIASQEFAQFGLAIFDRAWKDCPRRAFSLIWMPVGGKCGGNVLSLAHMSENKSFIAHECCQRWVNKVLYGSIYVKSLRFGCVQLPSWLKVILSAVFVLPTLWWIGLSENVDKKRPWRNCQKENGAAGGRSDSLKNPRSTETTTAPLLTQGNCSTASLRSFQASVGTELRVMRNYQAPLAAADEVNTEDSVAGVRTRMGTSSGSFELVDTSSTVDVDPALTFHSSRQLASESGCCLRVKEDCCLPLKRFLWTLHLFYCTPIAKYWISLIFRCLHLIIFGLAVAQPMCGTFSLDLIAWGWSFVAWTEAIWVFHVKRQACKIEPMIWRLMDIIFTLVFLLSVLIFRILDAQIQYGNAHFGRCVMCLFLLYLCYATMFTYVPMSKTLGPLLVRLRLMCLRDVLSYLVLVTLVICACAVVIHAIIYPDYPANLEMYRRAFHRAWFTLFLTPIDDLEAKDSCAQAPGSSNYCASSPYINNACPVPSSMAYFVVIQYLIILKLISFPLLVALFSRTAKEVDEQSDMIWKYQFYELVTEFNLRPVLPPPLTPLAFLLSLCGRWCCPIIVEPSWLWGGSDVVDGAGGAGSQPGAYVSHIAHVVKQRDADYYNYWRSLARQYWPKTEAKIEPVGGRKFDSASKAAPSSGFPASAMIEGDYYPNTLIRKLAVPNSWAVPVPQYWPPAYSRPCAEFAPTLQTSVDADLLGKASVMQHFSYKASWNSEELLNSRWITRKSWLTADNDEEALLYSLTANRVPRNPIERCGLIGRGSLCRFGPNHMLKLVVLARNSFPINDDVGLRVLLRRPVSCLGGQAAWELPYAWMVSGDSVQATLASVSQALDKVGCLEQRYLPELGQADQKLTTWLAARMSHLLESSDWTAVAGDLPETGDSRVVSQSETVIFGSMAASYYKTPLNTDNSWVECFPWILCDSDIASISNFAQFHWADVPFLPNNCCLPDVELINRAFQFVQDNCINGSEFSADQERLGSVSVPSVLFL